MHIQEAGKEGGRRRVTNGIRSGENLMKMHTSMVEPKSKRGRPTPTGKFFTFEGIDQSKKGFLVIVKQHSDAIRRYIL